MIRLLSGDCRDVLPTLPAESVQCCITSPPYYALRSYLDAAHHDKHREIGSEPTPDEYLATMVQVFRQIRRVMRNDATCWVNLGSSYASGGTRSSQVQRRSASCNCDSCGICFARLTMSCLQFKAKDLMMMPELLALCLQADGWWVRDAVTWCKVNPMPESVRDRMTKATEMVYLLTKRPTYYFDQEAIRQNGANCRNWWPMATHAFAQSHFATFPPELAERCIKAGTRPGDTVLDPFAGAGTSLLVADRLQRDAIGIELNTAYTEMAMERCRADAPLLTSFPPAEPPEDERMADLFAGDEYERRPSVVPERTYAFRNSGRYVNQGPQPSNGASDMAAD